VAITKGDVSVSRRPGRSTKRARVIGTPTHPSDLAKLFTSLHDSKLPDTWLPHAALDGEADALMGM
jgi:hypothetical protein